MSAPSPWVGSVPVASLADATTRVTVVEGSTFALSDRNGDMHQDLPQGLFVLDVRVLAKWILHVDGAPLESLAVAEGAPFEATFVGRVHPGGRQADSDLLVMRHRHVGNGMREQVVVHNYGQQAATVAVQLYVEADFADVFAVKESRVRPTGPTRYDTADRHLRLSQPGLSDRQVVIDLSVPAAVEPGVLTWYLPVDAGAAAELCLQVAVEVGGELLPLRFGCGEVDQLSEPERRFDEWRNNAAVLRTDDAPLQQAVDRAVEDLGALRIFDPDHPELAVVAAGAPWFMALFGRDSLLTSWMALLIDPMLAVGTLETLARLQGDVEHDETEEQPGRILHEVRFERSPSGVLGGGSIYYGSVDATPLFVMLLGELHRWGLADDVVRRLLPHADRALTWIADHGDRDGDGYVEYQRSTPEGLANQGWKDSWDGINFADGRLADPPIALCEVQAYTYAAYVARAQLAAEVEGDQRGAEHYRSKATELKASFDRDFWLEDRGWFAVGLDGDKQPIDALTSNLGHCLWSGIVDERRAARVADHLLSPEMFTGWGLRTLATSMGRYNPISYHNGSVWPHDTALAVAGLMRYGFVDHAQRLCQGLLDAAATFDGRLPELFAGLDRSELATPAIYPASCSPQAWAAASPLLLLRSLLRFDPQNCGQRLNLAPRLPDTSQRVELRGVEVGDRTLDLSWVDGRLTTEGLGGIELDEGPLQPPAPRLHRPDDR